MALTDKLKAIGNAIRAKTGGTEELTLDQMVTEIEGIEGGSGGINENLFESTEPTKDLKLSDLSQAGVVNFPNATTIGERAFFGWASYILAVNFPVVTNICTEAFSECGRLRAVNAPNAETIGASAFNKCQALSAADFPNVTELGGSAFNKCTMLHSVNFPKLEIIPYSAFSDCEHLTDINIPQAVTISNFAFSNSDGHSNNKLTTIDLPKVTSIGKLAFLRCTNLSSVILRTTETVCVCDLTAFEQTPMLTGQGHIYVPTVMYEYYRAAYEAALDQSMPGFFDILFRKIEDYPEICG